MRRMTMNEYLWLLLPFAVLIFIIGQIIYTLIQKRKKKRKPKLHPPDVFVEWAEREFKRIKKMD